MVPLAILTIALVAVAGRLIGAVRFRGIGLGSAGVLFAGILFGQFGVTVDKQIAEFAKEFGLILFVFTIGLQLGPGIIQLWRQQGWLLNGMAFSIVAIGLLMVVGLERVCGLGVFPAAGIFSGATTNTPSLGAAQQAVAALRSSGPADAGVLASAYAVSYPGGIIGIIAAMLILRAIFRIDAAGESRRIADEEADRKGDVVRPIERRSLLVDNDRLGTLPFSAIPGVEETGVRISRVKRPDDENVHVATEETRLRRGDVIQVVGTDLALDRFVPLIGLPSDIDLMHRSGDARFRRIVVTDPRVLHKPLRELSLDHRYNVSVTRIRRAGIEMTPRGSTCFHYGDVVQVVGDEHSLDLVSEVLGNSVQSLGETDFAPVFLGIATGVLLGMIPLTLPGVPFPIKLGLAGGPLVAAILLSLIGSIGRVVWYIPTAANLALRELGITLFLACAGLGAGESFFRLAFTPQGATWMLAGLAVTMTPLLIVAILARRLAGLNYLTICGVIAGSMTDPPALAFANTLDDSDAAATAYAAVYPLTMVLRIVAAQAIVYGLAFA